ncbi:hypothetical protein BCV72DRAFT_305881 [Rhizopus microsporus var. microsporus]|uniref:Uncharacterized protein n=1 Tax=Rhizopus microsporus var. microsporus TaxID=86635 RepID=A0A1X0R1Z7_RHIZD|nr:hypothetical protein BCV72DRAFT_305881 [Rhizopus microsporus var. microsporus]
MNGHTDKTNVDLNYAAILTNLSKGQLDSLNVEDFIEQENINLGQHQKFYQKQQQLNEVHLPNIDESNTLFVVNSFMSLTETIPDTKQTCTESIERINAAMSIVNQTIQSIENAQMQ